MKKAISLRLKAEGGTKSGRKGEEGETEEE
jgi:hypothetical protein